MKILRLTLIMFTCGVMASCQKAEQAKLLFVEETTDGKKVEIWHHPESDFEYKSEVILVIITDSADPENFAVKEWFPNSQEYNNMMRKNLTASIRWGNKPFQAHVTDTVTKATLIDTLTEPVNSGDGKPNLTAPPNIDHAPLIRPILTQPLS